MKLTPQQLQEFDERGYLFLPDCFSEEEIAALRSEADKIYASNRQEVCARNRGRRAPPSRRIRTTRPFVCWARIHG